MNPSLYNLASQSQLGNQGSQIAQGILTQTPPPRPAGLGGVLNRVSQLAEIISGLHAIADHAVGHPSSDTAAAPAGTKYNGMLEEIEAGLDSLIDLASFAHSRLKKLT
jgi:hypothetical protein